VGFPVLAFAARLPDTPLTSAVHLVAGGSLVWLAANLARVHIDHPEYVQQ
jgi:hypothetical protein